MKHALCVFGLTNVSIIVRDVKIRKGYFAGVLTVKSYREFLEERFLFFTARASVSGNRCDVDHPIVFDDRRERVYLGFCEDREVELTNGRGFEGLGQEDLMFLAAIR